MKSRTFYTELANNLAFCRPPIGEAMLRQPQKSATGKLETLPKQDGVYSCGP